MEERLGVALGVVEERIAKEYGLTVVIERRKFLDEIVDDLNTRFEQSVGRVFTTAFDGPRTSMQPDGGFTYVKEWEGTAHCILVAEAKRQGTNKARIEAGLKKQARGNAIERLGKNMRGFDAMFVGEQITPFVCFGEGDDFGADSSIIDRVATLNGFFPLNEVFVHKQSVGADTLKPVSLFFREEPWTPEEMADVMTKVCAISIPYFRKTYRLP